MNKSVKKALMAAAATATMATAFVGINATGASAMNIVACTGSEFTQATMHYPNSTGNGSDDGRPCFANGGEWVVKDAFGSDSMVLTHIWTGNNRVQYFADGRWQPDQPFDKNHDYDVPNALIQKLRIV